MDDFDIFGPSTTTSTDAGASESKPMNANFLDDFTSTPDQENTVPTSVDDSLSNTDFKQPPQPPVGVTEEQPQAEEQQQQQEDLFNDPPTVDTSDPVPSANDDQWNFDSTNVAEPSQSVESNVEPDSLPRPTEQNDSDSSAYIDETTARVEAIKRRIEEEIAARDANEARRKEELREQAKQDLQRWYQDRERRMNENRERMKSDETKLVTTALEKSDKDRCDWAKVIRLLEFSPGSQLSKGKRDITRMKQTIINAKRHAEAKNSSNGL